MAKFALRGLAGEKGCGIGERLEIGEEGEIASVEGSLQPFKEQSAEEPGERFDCQKEGRAAGDPPCFAGERPPPGTTQWTWG